MKKIFSLLFVCSFLVSAAIAQTMSFCGNLTPEDLCKKSSRTFYMPNEKGAAIYVVTNLPSEVGTTKVIYKLYRFGEDEEEIYVSALSQDLSPNMKTFYKQIVFTQESGYKIYLFTDSGKLICSAEVSVLEDYGN